MPAHSVNSVNIFYNFIIAILYSGQCEYWLVMNCLSYSFCVTLCVFFIVVVVATTTTCIITS